MVDAITVAAIVTSFTEQGTRTMSDTVTKLDSDSAAAMHHDHRRWESDVSMWRDDIDNWKDEHREAFKELKRIETRLREHETSLESHCNSLDTHQAHTLQHEHDIATDCRNQNALNQQAADEHAKEAESHQRLADAHERMKKHHHTVMAHVAMLKATLDAAV
ncbi:hypothetical protein RSSM_01423 [Rhodopirellula sallentina SM41]|uniref:Uncharacterized protein n=2 Tax=Rhodopirellula TaxID=265488 RepID=M5UH11_9BACT|nr:hypothetical protein RSSM_01423 [Rhodopirellula sallentina SM41]